MILGWSLVVYVGGSKDAHEFARLEMYFFYVVAQSGSSGKVFVWAVGAAVGSVPGVASDMVLESH